MRATFSFSRGVAAGYAMLAGLTLATAGSEAHPPKPRGSTHDKAETHGGAIIETNEFRFEVAFERDRIHVHGYDRGRDPIDLQGVTGTVRVAYNDDRSPITVELKYLPGSRRTAHEHDRADYQPVAPEVGHHVADVSFALVAEGDATAEIELENLPGRLEQRAEFTEAFKLARPHEFDCPTGCIAPPDDPGACPECGAMLRIRRFIYTCSDHPLVTARDADETCWIDGQRLQKIPQRADNR